jgi:hypothetical protein
LDKEVAAQKEEEIVEWDKGRKNNGKEQGREAARRAQRRIFLLTSLAQ